MSIVVLRHITVALVTLLQQMMDVNIITSSPLNASLSCNVLLVDIPHTVAHTVAVNESHYL